MAESQLKRGEVLMRYEPLYIHTRQNQRKICDPTSSNHHNSTLLHGKTNLSQPYHSLGLWEATTHVWGL